METKLIELIQQNTYYQLSDSEKEQLLEWCTSEEEYNQLKVLFDEIQAVNLTQHVIPHPRTKQQLDRLYASHYARKSPITWNSFNVFNIVYPKQKPLYLRPLIQGAAVITLCLLSLPLLLTKTTKLESNQLAKVERKLDQRKQLASPKKDSVSPSKTNANTYAQVQAPSPSFVSKTEIPKQESVLVNEAAEYNVLMDNSLIAEPPVLEKKIRLSAYKTDAESMDEMAVDEVAFSTKSTTGVNSPASVFELLTASF